MVPFLKQVADHYFSQGDISRNCFVFPNRRSMVFFRKWLSAAVAASSDSPILEPQMMTVNDLFHKLSGYNPTDKVCLLLELYECYRKLNPKAEELDEFIFWGDVILADFNDVDKYMADPVQVFANVMDLKAIQDDFSYLSDVQRSAIESFVSHFSDRTGKLTVDIKSDDPDVKAAFLQIWNILPSLYRDFKDALMAKDMAYEGMVYRHVAENFDSLDLSEKYVFVGLNALNECEKEVMRRLRNNGKAEFCWDWCGHMVQDPKNRSSVFMSENVKDFPQAFQPSGKEGETSFNVLSVPSSYGQVKHLSAILENVGYDDSAMKDSSDTAVVLADEGLLIPLLNSIPENVHDINVTMGYPMSACRLNTFMGDLARMQLHLRQKGQLWHYYHKQVWDLLSSGLMRTLMAGEEMEECRQKVESVRKESRYYIPQEDLSGYPLLDMMFRPVVVDPLSSDPEQTDAFAGYLQNVVAEIAAILSDDPDMAMEVEFAHRYYTSINALRCKKLSVKPATFIRLLDSLMAQLTVPFKGEPLKGLQIMGPLETRALDFRNVIIISCNEGTFPRRNVSSSFIPPELRKAFGLPTYEYQDAIWAYYFYRLVSRADNVWMVYDSRTEGLKRGEESRYIKQLKYHFGVDPAFHMASAELSASKEEKDWLDKTDEMMEVIDRMTYSVSSLQNYVLCPMRFCCQSVLKLVKDQDIAESLDNAMIGNVYHNLMWALYHGKGAMESSAAFEKLADGKQTGMPEVSREYLSSWLEREEDIRRKVVSLMMAELNSDEIAGRDLVVLRVIMRYVRETILKDIALMDRYGVDSIEILGLERKVYANIGGNRFFGVIDRIDSLAPGMVRLVDYKSGADNPSVISVTDETADAFVGKIFDADYKVKKENKAALQFYIYDRMAVESGIAGRGEQICNSMYSTSDIFRNTPAVYPLSPRFASLMDERVSQILDEIKDKDIPFRMTSDAEACRYCDFKMVCGR